jgi:hypothetical protein
MQLDRISQQNAAQTAKLSSTTQGLAAQAQHLRALVARFKLTQGDRAASSPVGTPVAGAKVIPLTVKGRATATALTPVSTKTGTDDAAWWLDASTPRGRTDTRRHTRSRRII